MDLLEIIEKEEGSTVGVLARKLKIPREKLEKIIKELEKHEVLECDRETGMVRLAPWLMRIALEMKEIYPVTATIILPKDQQTRIGDLTLMNLTGADLELNLRFRIKSKEIAISKIA